MTDTDLIRDATECALYADATGLPRTAEILRALVADLREARDQAQGNWELAQHNYAEFVKAEAELGAAREALRRYGGHENVCLVIQLGEELSDCTCGWAALAAGEGAKP